VKGAPGWAQLAYAHEYGGKPDPDRAQHESWQGKASRIHAGKLNPVIAAKAGIQRNTVNIFRWASGFPLLRE